MRSLKGVGAGIVFQLDGIFEANMGSLKDPWTHQDVR